MIRPPPKINWRNIAVRLARAHGSQAKAAKALGLSVGTLAQLSSGQSKHPLFATGLRLLAAYSVHVEPIPGATELAEAMRP